MKYIETGIYQDYSVSETNAKGYTRYFEYDAIGRLTEKTDRNGRVTTYTYDAAGRLTSESWLDSSNNAVNTFTYQYDILGNLLSAFDGVSCCDYTYDIMNRIDSKIILFDAQMAIFSYSYDALGRQTESSLRLNGVQDRTINIEYDYLGRAISAELTGNALNDILAEFDYNAVGALTDVRRFEWDDTDELYNLIAQSQYQYNARNQITSINHQDSNNNTIVSHGYLYDADGNISQYTNSLDGSVLYDYDFLGQLIGADYSNTNIPDELYQYDLNGNRELVTNANGDLVVYSTGLNNELNSDGNYSYTYDAEGNRISKTNSTGTERELYEWDYRNRLSKVTKQTFDSITETWQTVQIVEYAYDYNNVLIRKVLDADSDGISDSKTIFLPENYQTAVQLDDADLSDSTDAVVSHRYLWTPGQQDKLLADVTPTETLWTLTDHLGTIRDIIQNTASGLIVPAHVIYDAYGNILSCKDPNGMDIESPVLFGFTGKYFDADTQLQNNVNRWYDATTGRWLSTDPIGFNGNDTNLYRYAGNKGVIFKDSLGLISDSVTLSINEAIATGNISYLRSLLEQQIRLNLSKETVLYVKAAIRIMEYSDTMKSGDTIRDTCQTHKIQCLMTRLADYDWYWGTGHRCDDCYNSCIQNNGVWPCKLWNGKTCNIITLKNRNDYWLDSQLNNRYLFHRSYSLLIINF